jgi:predicted ATP-grasp superfamily ATP-dependent carboligase
MDDYTRKMVEILNWNGVGHFDFIANKDYSKVKLIEMNPRLWGALNLSIVNGYDFPKAYLSMLLNGVVDETSFAETAEKYSSMWIVGELISLVSDIKRIGVRAIPAFVRDIKNASIRCSYDDFRMEDPLPFFVEMLYYAAGFCKSGGNTNPTVDEMMV